ncbi:MAG: hypothetical protein AB7G88_05070 [Thermomicrobiales bacterium]
MRLTRRQMLRTSGAVLLSSQATTFVTPGSGWAAQTPDTGNSSPNATLLEFASCFPLTQLSENASQGSDLLTFGDFANRLQSVGLDLNDIADPTEKARAFAQATLPVPASDLMVSTFRTDDPLGLLGWTIDQIDQSAFVMSSSGILTALRGSFDVQMLQNAWNTQGYQQLDLDGVSVASLSPDGEMDLTSEIGRVTIRSALNAVLLDDGLLFYAPTLDALTLMIEAHDGQITSLGADPIVQNIVGAVSDPLAGAIILSAGSFASTMPLVQSGENGLEFGEMPEPGPIPLMGLIGFVSGPAVPENDLMASNVEVTASGSTLVATRHFLSLEEADLAARRTLLTLESQASFVTGQPWTEIFAGWRVAVDQERRTVLTEIDLYANEAIWSQLIYSRDAWFLYG